MPWVVGIDEAGYGPNLGPLAQAAVAVRLPDHDPAGWDALRPHVRRAGEKKDDRVLVDDSKLVHQGKYGFAKLEAGVFAALGRAVPAEFGAVLGALAAAGGHDDLAREAWFDPAEVLPRLTPLPLACGFHAPFAAARLTPAPVFNSVVGASGSKATVLTLGLVELLRAAEAGLPAGEPLVAVCDQLGGRRGYGPYLAAAFPAGRVEPEPASGDESGYRVAGLGRDVRVVFRPEADRGSLPAALASMLAKYLREVCMGQFNRYWAGHVPGIKPTAGYPVDAKRFFADIQPAMARLGVADDAVWRVK